MFRRSPFVVIAAAGAMSTLAACTCNGCPDPDDTATTDDTADTADATGDQAAEPVQAPEE